MRLMLNQNKNEAMLRVSANDAGTVYSKKRRFVNFEFVHLDSAGESNPKTYVEKAIFDILSNSKRGCIFRL